MLSSQFKKSSRKHKTSNHNNTKDEKEEDVPFSFNFQVGEAGKGGNDTVTSSHQKDACSKSKKRKERRKRQRERQKQKQREEEEEKDKDKREDNEKVDEEVDDKELLNSCFGASVVADSTAEPEEKEATPLLHNSKANNPEPSSPPPRTQKAKNKPVLARTVKELTPLHAVKLISKTNELKAPPPRTPQTTSKPTIKKPAMQKKSPGALAFNTANKGKAVVNKSSMLTHKQKKSTQQNNPPSCNAFSFGFSFDLENL